MKLHVGTSGFSYKEWKGSFYPKDLKAADMLRYYAERFDTVEMNNTFYRMPKAENIAAWAAEVPAHFRFVIKASQRITHFQRLKDCGESIKILLRVSAELKDRLGPLLFQLPPNLKKDMPRLREFLTLLPSDRRVAFEFRHESWLDEEVFQLFRDQNIALCIAEADDGVEVPFVSTADWGYVRLRMLEYNDTELQARIKLLRGQKWTEAYVFFKHEDEARGPKMALRLLELWRVQPR
jgi:uncharacterized protein YecE (DUF72 family)